jgi:hypothetical protein
MADSDNKSAPRRPDFLAKKAGHRVSFRDNVDTIPLSETDPAENNYPDNSILGPTENGHQVKPTLHDDPWDRKFVLTLGEPARISKEIVAQH